MTNIKYIVDKEGNKVLPVTHIKAVRDDSGTSVETLIQKVKDDTYTKDEINNIMVNTPETDVFVVSTLPATGESNTIYRVPDSSDNSVYKDYGYDLDKNQWVLLATHSAGGDGSLDISMLNATDGTPKRYASLSAALAAVPTNLRKGGMNIKFILATPAEYSLVKTTNQTSHPDDATELNSDPGFTTGTYGERDLMGVNLPTTIDGTTYYYYVESSTSYTIYKITYTKAASVKYVQYMLTNTAWSTAESDWIGVDDEPVTGSENLVKSGGVAAITLVGDDTIDSPIIKKEEGTIYTTGSLTTSSKYYRYSIDNTNGDISSITVSGRVNTQFAQVAFYNSLVANASTLIKTFAGKNAKNVLSVVVPKECKLVMFSVSNETTFSFKIYAKNITRIANFAKEIKDVDDKVEELSIIFDQNNVIREDGVILLNGNRSTSDISYRYFIKNNNYKRIKAFLRNSSSNACLVFYNSETISSSNVIAAYSKGNAKTLYEYDIPEDCVVIGISTQINSLTETNPAYFKIYARNLLQINTRINEVKDDINYKVGNNSNIISLNQPLDMGRKLHHLSKNGTALTLLHFSDIHGDSDNLYRLIEFRNKYNTYIKDSICTGDLIWNLYTDNFVFWTNTEDANNILCTIGNHETALTNNVWSGATNDDVYNKFIAPNIESWGLPEDGHTGTNLYYYKDYVSLNIRLIALCPYYDLVNQNVWLQDVLNDAKDKDYAVIIAEHNPFNAINAIDCTFTAMNTSITATWGNMITSFVTSVDAFQNDGGEFICWIAGHMHRDMVSVNKNYPKQLMISASAATHVQGSGNADYRLENTKSQDNFNILSFDTTYKTITILRIGQDIDAYMRHRGSLCINYETKEVIWND